MRYTHNNHTNLRNALNILTVRHEVVLEWEVYEQHCRICVYNRKVRILILHIVEHCDGQYN